MTLCCGTVNADCVSVTVTYTVVSDIRLLTTAH